MDIESLKLTLKQIVVEECDVDIEPDNIADDEQLIGSDGRMALDSLDALSISLEVKSRFGVHIDGGNETRAALASITSLADYILSEQG